MGGPDFTLEDELAIRVFNAAQNGMGGIDWHGLEVMAEMFGIEDLDGLIERVLVIKSWTPEKGSWSD